MNDHDLISQLQQMPAPAPSEGFEARVLAAAHARIGDGRRRLHTGWALATAASIAVAVLVTLQVAEPPAPVPGATPNIAVVETQPLSVRIVDVVFRSAYAIENATLTIELAPNLALENRPDVQSLSWQTDLRAGANKLSLPVRLLDGQAGDMMITLQHGNERQQMTVHIKES